MLNSPPSVESLERVHNASIKVAEALLQLDVSECRTVLRMALVAIDREGLLVDPDTIGVRQVATAMEP